MQKGKQESSSFFRDTFIIIAVTLSLFVVLEVALRILFPHAGTLQKIPHERYLFTLSPDSTVKMELSPENGGAVIFSKINRWGFRGEDIEADTNETRIMVFGDSNIQANFSALENSYVKQIEMNLEEKSKTGFEVINAGVSGFGPDQVLLRIDEEIDIWKPDLVVVNIFADNDFGDILRNGLFKLDNNGEIHFTPNESDVFDRVLLNIRRLYVFVAAKKFAKTVLEESKNDETELESLLRRVDEEYENYLNGVEKRRSGNDHYDLDIALDPGSASSALKIRLMKGILRGIMARVSEGDRRLLFVIQPSVKDISTNAELNYRTLRKTFDSYHRRNLVDAVEGILRDEGASFVSLYDAYVTEDRTPHYFVLDNNHWNDSGQKLAADLVSDYILDHFEFP
jgi:lysophospholipase L1-like esterase